MRKESFVIVTLIVMFAILHLGEARLCYSCVSDSKDSKGCSNPGKEQELNCTKSIETCFACDADVNGTAAYMRGCGSIPLTQDVKFELSGHCFECDSDLCNNADAISINKIALESLVMLWIARFVLTNSY